MWRVVGPLKFVKGRALIKPSPELLLGSGRTYPVLEVIQLPKSVIRQAGRL